MKPLIIVITIILLNVSLYGQSIDDIKKKLGVKPETTEAEKGQEGSKGFRQLGGRYCIVQVKDISINEAEQILRHMDSLIGEFLKLYEYPFGLQKCYVIVYGLKKDYDRIAKGKDLERAGAFSYRKGLNHYAVTYYSDGLYPTLSHEAFHLFIRNMFKKDAPIWFNEGMACYFETCAFTRNGFETNRINKGRLITAKEALHSRQWPMLKDLVRFPWEEFHGCNEVINYAASWSLIYFLKNKNEDSFRGFVRDLVLGKSFSTSIRQNYGIDQKKLGDEWIRYIEKISG